MSPINKANHTAIFSRIFGNNIQRAREFVAAGLIRCHVGPNTLTILGLLTTIAAGVFLAYGAGDKVGSGPDHSWFGFTAAMLIILSAAFDILDGAVARNSKKITKAGAFLDSSCDRVADAAIFIGIIMYYVRRPDIPHNHLFILAAAVAFTNAEIISYVKARAENFIDSCPVGYWQRGERIAAIFIGLFSGHIATVMVQLAIFSSFTVLRRIVFAFRQIRREETNRTPLDPTSRTGYRRAILWYYKRGSLPYDLVTATNIAIILFIDLQRMT
ncbi:MAG: CDP-alcohol phosphatidyltransferase family protein [Sedimentisphaerales bacterium]|nr:CDP-alcohol phosphatidyltransferase family protein [Sedimentisphaerales bacterium]